MTVFTLTGSLEEEVGSERKREKASKYRGGSVKYTVRRQSSRGMVTRVSFSIKSEAPEDIRSQEGNDGYMSLSNSAEQSSPHHTGGSKKVRRSCVVIEEEARKEK